MKYIKIFFWSLKARKKAGKYSFPRLFLQVKKLLLQHFHRNAIATAISNAYKNIKLYLGIVVSVLSLCVHPKKVYFYWIVINLPLWYRTPCSSVSFVARLGVNVECNVFCMLLHPSESLCEKAVFGFFLCLLYLLKK